MAALLRAGANKQMKSTEVYGLHPIGSTALSIAKTMQSELGIDRKDIIGQLEYDAAAAVAMKQGKEGEKVSMGVLGKLRKAKAKSQAKLKIEETLGYKTEDAVSDRARLGHASEDATAAAAAGGGKKKLLSFGDVVMEAVPSLAMSEMQSEMQRLEREKRESEQTAGGYELAGNTVHIGSIGHETHRAAMDERGLMDRFSEFGQVIAAVIRYRDPEPDHPHNSWALLAFAELSSVDRLMGESETVKVNSGGYDGDSDVNYTVRRIDPDKAMNSTGSFGQIFQTCRERVKKYEQAQSVRLVSLSLDPKPPWISKLAPDFYVLGCV